MIRLLFALTCLAATPLWANPFSGVFGTDDPPEETCALNPMTQTLSPDHNRISFHWDTPVESYTGAMITDFGGTVTAMDAQSLTFLRDNETRLDPQGALILWTMHLLPGGSYCYTSTGWPEEGCGPPYLRCSSDPPIS